jgi:hypothetical protein
VNETELAWWQRILFYILVIGVLGWMAFMVVMTVVIVSPQ